MNVFLPLLLGCCVVGSLSYYMITAQTWRMTKDRTRRAVDVDCVMPHQFVLSLFIFTWVIIDWLDSSQHINMCTFSSLKITNIKFMELSLFRLQGFKLMLSLIIVKCCLLFYECIQYVYVVSEGSKLEIDIQTSRMSSQFHHGWATANDANSIHQRVITKRDDAIWLITQQRFLRDRLAVMVS